jgi:hypothetical protein
VRIAVRESRGNIEVSVERGEDQLGHVAATSGLSVGPLGSYLVDSTASVIGDRFGGQATPTSLATLYCCVLCLPRSFFLLRQR